LLSFKKQAREGWERWGEMAKTSINFADPRWKQPKQGVISELALPGAAALSRARQRWLNVSPGTCRVTCQVARKLRSSQGSPSRSIAHAFW